MTAEGETTNENAVTSNPSAGPKEEIKVTTPEKGQAARSRKDFLFLEELGEGSYSSVYLGSERATSRKFAVKVCYKTKIIREKKVTQIFREKDILRLLSTKENAHPFVVQLFCTFQDEESLYFVLTLATRGDLLKAMKKAKRLNVEQCRFVAAEIVSALGHIHSFQVVHRDMKPENILIKDDGHIMLSDFGCCRRLGVLTQNEKTNDGTERKRRCSFVGTSHYVSPEILNGVEVQQATDYWSFGVTLFEILAGRRPFSDVSEYLIYQRILKLRYSFDDIPEEATAAKDLIQRLLILSPEERLGSIEKGGMEDVKSHEFFSAIEDWNELCKIPSPLL